MTIYQLIQSIVTTFTGVLDAVNINKGLLTAQSTTLAAMDKKLDAILLQVTAPVEPPVTNVIVEHDANK